MSQNKTKTVVVGSHGATVYVNHENPDILKRQGVVVLQDPDLTYVRGVSPSYWSWDGEKLVEMSSEQKEKRDFLDPPAQESPKISLADEFFFKINELKDSHKRLHDRTERDFYQLYQDLIKLSAKYHALHGGIKAVYEEHGKMNDKIKLIGRICFFAWVLSIFLFVYLMFKL